MQRSAILQRCPFARVSWPKSKTDSVRLLMPTASNGAAAWQAFGTGAGHSALVIQTSTWGKLPESGRSSPDRLKPALPTALSGQGALVVQTLAWGSPPESTQPVMSHHHAPHTPCLKNSPLEANSLRGLNGNSRRDTSEHPATFTHSPLPGMLPLRAEVATWLGL
jgi:hypothetical protein